VHHDAAGNLPGTVEKIIKPIRAKPRKCRLPFKVETIRIRKFRIANILVDARGEAVSSRRGAAVQIVVRPKPKDPIE
jgi:hypothetical protein